jgi:predicted membrane channel-forming protein YqfA (hemolysin III family)
MMLLLNLSQHIMITIFIEGSYIVYNYIPYEQICTFLFAIRSHDIAQAVLLPLPPKSEITDVQHHTQPNIYFQFTSEVR